MITGKTSNGFEYSVNEKVIEDWRFIKAIARAESKDKAEMLSGTVDLCNMILGEDGETRLVEQIKERNGEDFVSAQDIYNVITEIIKALSTNSLTKNSSPSPV